jgi:hypothetical protein
MLSSIIEIEEIYSHPYCLISTVETTKSFVQKIKTSYLFLSCEGYPSSHC